MDMYDENNIQYSYNNKFNIHKITYLLCIHLIMNLYYLCNRLSSIYLFLLFLNINHINGYLSHLPWKSSLNHQRKTTAKIYHKFHRSQCKLNGNKKSSSSSNNRDNNGQINQKITNSEIPDEFLEWERLERQNQKQDLLRQVEIEQSQEGDVPDYMLKLLADYNSEDSENPYNDITEIASKLPIIAVIGRPNTGKSTFVNKLTNSYKDGSIVHDEPGITRDRTYRPATWDDYHYQVVDTGGIIFDDSKDIFANRITEQALIALNEAHAAILVCDGQEGVTPLDMSLAEWLRRNNKVPLYLAINKCESETQGYVQAQDFWQLGLGEPHPVSAIHGTGVGDLLDKIFVTMPKVKHVLKENVTNVAFIGRPNVGKSSLFNRLHGSSRAIVSEVAGTTRDAIDAIIERDNVKYRIIDTAGIRRKGKIEYGPEFFMINRAFKAIRRSEVVIFLLDAIDGIVDQDRILAERIAEDGRGCIIVLNKWDAIDEKDDKTYLQAIDNIRAQLPVLRWAQIILASAKTGQRTEKLFAMIDKAAEQFSRRISTSIINEVVQEATLWMAPPTVGSRSGRIYYSIQVTTSPPTIVHFVNDPALFTDNYQRYLERKMREALSFEGTPVKFIFRGKALRDVSRAAKKGDFSTSRIS